MSNIDFDRQRRNLITSSVMIITVCAAGATVEKFNAGGVLVALERPYVLAWLLGITHVYFYYRFSLVANAKTVDIPKRKTPDASDIRSLKGHIETRIDQHPRFRNDIAKRFPALYERQTNNLGYRIRFGWRALIIGREQHRLPYFRYKVWDAWIFCAIAYENQLTTELVLPGVIAWLAAAYGLASIFTPINLFLFY